MTTNNLKAVFYVSISILLYSCNKESINEIEIQETLSLQASESDYLDYGIYWFNSENESTKGYDEKNDKKIEVSSSYYDASKPTVIYFHGWQLDSSIDEYNREDFQFTDSEYDTNINTVEIWKRKGWNVGIFYWNQFADESELKDAEAKIWSINGPKNMRYRLSDGSYSEEQSPTSSLAQEAYNQISEIIAENTSNDIRFVGHSLGNQLASYTAFLFSEAISNNEIPLEIMPNRLELLDPFWSKDAKNYLTDYNGDGSNDWTGERVRWYIDEMIKKNNLATTWYSSSLILDAGIGDQNESLKDIVTYQSQRYWYVDAISIGEKHVNTRHSYFWSLEFDAPLEVKVNWLLQRKETGNTTASASTTIERIREMMGDENYWDQVEGRYTPSPEDDKFQIK
ncbi:hypothetical protein KO500_10935 [Cellulophaga baltica]|uniref:hypothetical protein n=1 Tax=Cellulophaga TaxID=104264 RepID=UPI001C067DF2|nr:MULTISPECIES: hypothetical protein [Cellulophaga]MBU2996954.1 hypothetical protein [Cellulophaga baltica]MDO6768352.1 hypothetical protein [Cellulophaga sp. 1_MG-2023]